jgi:type II secretory pathway pseudopilin PulG
MRTSATGSKRFKNRGMTLVEVLLTIGLITSSYIIIAQGLIQFLGISKDIELLADSLVYTTAYINGLEEKRTPQKNPDGSEVPLRFLPKSTDSTISEKSVQLSKSIEENKLTSDLEETTSSAAAEANDQTEERTVSTKGLNLIIHSVSIASPGRESAAPSDTVFTDQERDRAVAPSQEGGEGYEYQPKQIVYQAYTLEDTSYIKEEDNFFK